MKFIFFLFCFFGQKDHLPRPLLPTKRRSLNLATWFFMTAVQFRSSPHQLSSFPARIVTMVPSPTSVKATTLKATGRVLLERQWFGSAEHRIYGLPVRTVINFKTMKKKTIETYYHVWKVHCDVRVRMCECKCSDSNVEHILIQRWQWQWWWRWWWCECNRHALRSNFK